jgi:diguanylate cyclase (GGDEF)-like protein
MTRVLIIEDSRSFASLLAGRVRAELGFEVVTAATLAEARDLLSRDADFMAALVDINLPDAPDGQSVDLTLAAGVPTIVFTGQLSDALREDFWNRRIVDYVLKDCPENVDYVLGLLARLERNPGVAVLVVDDSRSFRFAAGRLLAAHRYRVLEAAGGREALRLLERHPEVRLLTVDSNMPDMEGCDLVRAIRRHYSKDALAVIGISGVGDARLPAKFIKSGANDFLTKPFQAEEFYTRLTQNLEMLERMARIREMAERDHLTRVYNRRHFFAAGERLLARARRAGQPVALAMLDLDHFKAVNDTHGHEAGDAALGHVAGIVAARFAEAGIVARLGGEEFGVLAPDMSPAAACSALGELRARIAASPVRWRGADVACTVSVGVCCEAALTLDEMLREADRQLYRAKAEGRDRICMAGTEAAAAGA